MGHVPLFNTAQLLHPSKSWITSELGELPQGPWDKLAWHQVPAGLSSSYCHCHLGTFPLATKALGPRRTTVKSQGISATELLRIWINPHTLLDFVTLLSAIVSSKPCNCKYFPSSTFSKAFYRATKSKQLKPMLALSVQMLVSIFFFKLTTVLET